MANIHNLTTPVGRIVGGSVWNGKTTDSKGQPLVVKSGANAGQPRKEFSFGVAFPKTPGVGHWANEAWLAPVWAFGHAEWPQGQASRRDFSWKIIDGDSTEPNKEMKRPCDKEGHPGNWVIWFSSGQAPRTCNANGTEIIPGEAIKTGYYVQVLGSVKKNEGETPGVYMNHSAVALAAYGPEIQSGPDISQAGFGNAALPPGASALPPAGMPAPAPAAPGVPPVPNAPGAPVPAPAPSLAPAYQAASAPTAPAFVPPAKVMTAKANGASYESFIAQGWVDEALVAQGYMMASAPAPLAPAPVPTAPAPMSVTPSPAFAQIPGAAPPPPAAAPARVMLPAAGGYTYEALIASGWTDATLVQHGKMAP